MTTVSVVDAKAVEGGTAYFTVSLSQASTSNVSFSYQTLSGTALEGVDFQGRSYSVTIAAGQTSATVAVPIYSDNLSEPDESFSLEIINPVNAALAGNATALRATGTILDANGGGGKPSLFVSSPILVEGNAGVRFAQFAVTLSEPPTAAISLAYHTADGSAVAGQDYVATSGTLTFAPGQTTAAVGVTVTGDTTIEASEAFSLIVVPTAAIANGADGAAGIATILDDDAGGTSKPTLSVADTKAIEGGTAYFTVSLSQASTSNVSFSYQTLSGTALEGVDFQGRSYSVTIAAGQTSATVAVPIYSDNLSEPDESFSLEIINPVNAALAGNATALRATGTILDANGGGGKPSLFVSSPILVEGNAGVRFAQFAVTLSEPPTAAISLAYHTADGSAVAGQDYVATSGTLTFAPGQTTAAVGVTVTGDTTIEASEAFSLIVVPTAAIANGADGAAGIATILDDDAGGTSKPTLSVADTKAIEGGTAYFTVSLSQASTSNVSFSYQTLSGTALEGVDFQGRSYSVTIAAGQTSATVAVPIYSDNLSEPNESFSLEITSPVNAALAGNATALRATGTILDANGSPLNPGRFHVKADYNLDGKSDLLWHQADGSIFTWYLQNDQVNGSDYIATFDSAQRLLATGDFDGDFKSDYMVIGSSSNIQLFTQVGKTLISDGYVASMPSNYSLLADADFNADGRTDLIWRDANNNGNTFLWDMKSNVITGGGYIANLSPNIGVISDGDFDGDGMHDLLLRDGNNGNLFLWKMNNTAVTSSSYIATMPTSQWELMASADLNGDGKTDLIWRNLSSGNMFDWQMNGATVTSGNYFATLSPSVYHVAATGDYNGDGQSDLIYEDTARNLTVDLKNGSASIGGGYIGTAPANWTLWDRQ